MIQFISHFTEHFTYLDSIRMALEGGCRWVQLRMKGASASELTDAAHEALSLCRAVGATLIIDDNVEVAKAVHADGVHLGQHDMPIAEARSLLGKDFIIGGTANTFQQVKAHATAGADYVGCGPFRFTTTKQGLAPVLGLEGYRGIIQQMRAENIDIPIVAIGGITCEDIQPLIATGVSDIALSGTVLRAADPVAEMKRIINTYIIWTN